MIVKKAWGEERWIVNTDLYCGKVLVLNKGWQCSEHRHLTKDETFFVVSGRVQLEYDNCTYNLAPGDVIRILPGGWHSFAGLEDSVMLEISTHHDDADVERRTQSGPINAL